MQDVEHGMDSVWGTLNQDPENQSFGLFRRSILNSPRFCAIPAGPVLEELHIAAPHKAAAALHFLADIMNSIDIMILTLSSSSVNVVFNASILIFMTQYMNAYVI